MAKFACVSALVCALATAGAATGHPGVHKTAWEHTTDVFRFFHNHRELQSTRPARHTLAWHARYAFNALIGKWDGVHACEGSWTDPGEPYYGGLQADMSFQRTYGGEFLAWWGTADHWPPWAQMTMAERAYRSGRGFGPWPVCGAYGG